MGIIALICAFILICAVPREIWAVLLYVGLILLVATVGLVATALWLIG